MVVSIKAILKIPLSGWNNIIMETVSTHHLKGRGSLFVFYYLKRSEKH